MCAYSHFHFNIPDIRFHTSHMRFVSCAVLVYFNAFEMCTLYCYAFVIFQVDHTLQNANVLGDKLRSAAHLLCRIEIGVLFILIPSSYKHIMIY